MERMYVEFTECSCCSGLTPWFERCDAHVLCPVCQEPPPYCEDKTHYSCESCGGSLDIGNYDNRKREYWSCTQCDYYETDDEVCDE